MPKWNYDILLKAHKDRIRFITREMTKLEDFGLAGTDRYLRLVKEMERLLDEMETAIELLESTQEKHYI